MTKVPIRVVWIVLHHDANVYNGMTKSKFFEFFDTRVEALDRFVEYVRTVDAGAGSVYLIEWEFQTYGMDWPKSAISASINEHIDTLHELDPELICIRDKR